MTKYIFYILIACSFAISTIVYVGITETGSQVANLGASAPYRAFKATSTPFDAITVAEDEADIYVPFSSVTSTLMAADTFCINNSSPDCITSWPSGSGTTINQLGQIGDVSTSTLDYGHLLMWNGTDTWIDTATSTLGITGAGTVTSVALTASSTFSVYGSPITTAGTFGLGLADGYTIPLTASTTEYDTAYGWGNHASAGYFPLSSWYATTTDGLAEGSNNLYFPGFTSLAADYSFTDNSSNWDTAYGWGNHASAAYIALTDLSSSATGLTYNNGTGDFSLTAGYVIPTSTRALLWDNAYSLAHNAVTLAGEDFLSLSTQQITANAINPDNLANTDFGDFSCNGTTCTLDATYLTTVDISANTNLDATYPIVLTGDTLSFSGLTTSTAPTSGNLAYWTGLNTLGSVR